MNPVTLTSTIVAVTVFPDRARITRQARCKAGAPGVQHMRFSDLPPTLHVDSVRAAARGTARAKLLGVSVAPRHYAQAPVPRV